MNKEARRLSIETDKSLAIHIRSYLVFRPLWFDVSCYSIDIQSTRSIGRHFLDALKPKLGTVRSLWPLAPRLSTRSSTWRSLMVLSFGELGTGTLSRQLLFGFVRSHGPNIALFPTNTLDVAKGGKTEGAEQMPSWSSTSLRPYSFPQCDVI